MKYILYTCLLLALCLGAGACRKFLGKEPDLRTHINSVSTVKQLLGTAYPNVSYWAFTEFTSDNMDWKKSFSSTGADLNIRDYLGPYTFTDVIGDGTDLDESDSYWNACFRAIASANKCLEFIHSLPKAEQQPYNPYKGEALLCRAYAHFMLVTLFAKPYDPATSGSDLGVPYVEQVEKNAIKKYTRATVAEVYAKIERDLSQGLPLIEDNAYEVQRYHFNRAAALTFATRFYLHKREYAKVINLGMSVFGTVDNLVNNLRPLNPGYRNLSYKEIQLRWASTDEKANLLIASTPSLYQHNYATKPAGLTSNGRSYFFDNGSKLAAGLFNGAASYGVPVYGRVGLYNFPKLREYFKLSSINANTGVPYLVAPLFTTEELLFNIAEAHILQKDTSQSRFLLNKLFFKQFQTGTTVFSASSGSGGGSDTLTVKKALAFYGNGKTQAAQIKNGKVDIYDPKQRYMEIDSTGNTHTRGIKDPLVAGLDSNCRALLKALLDVKAAVFFFEGMRWFDMMRHHLTIYHNTGDGRQLVLAYGENHRIFRVPSTAVEAGGLRPNPR